MSTLYTYNKQEFNADVSFNNTSTRISSTGLIGISGGIVNISGGVINMSSYTFPVLYASGDTKLTSRSGFTTFINNDKTSGNVIINPGSPNSNVIVENGNVGIGTASPGAKLSVEHNGIQANQTVFSVRTSNPTTDNYNLMDVGHGIGTTPSFVVKAAGGYVGIGTTNPADHLHVNGSFKVSNTSVNSGAGVSTSITSGNGPFGSIECFNTANTSKLPLSLQAYGGNVGIGNTAPGAKLEVRYSEIVADQTVLKLDTGETATSNYNLIQAGHGGVPKFVVKGSGNVGIGSSTPIYNLDVADGAYPKISIKSTAAYGTGKDCGLLFQNPAFVHAAIYGFDKSLITGGEFRGQLGFYTNSDNVLNERMTITAAGNVGIGYSSPGEKLYVNGTMKADEILNTNGGSRRLQIAAGILHTHWDGYYGKIYQYENAMSYVSYGDIGRYGHHEFWAGDNDNTTAGYSRRCLKIGGSFPLEVYSYNTISGTNYLYANNGPISNASRSFSPAINLPDGSVRAISFLAHSDKRIKKNIVDIDDGNALSILRQIQPKTYDYVDKLQRGTDSVIGFIAQEIKEVLPKAVTIVKDYVPTFYTNCQVVATDASNILLVTSPIDLSWNALHDQSGNAFVDAEGNASSDASGNKAFNVKLYDQSNNNFECKTTSILDKRSFLMDVSGSKMVDASGNLLLTNNGAYFLHGQEVDDFHNIDKGAIFTVVTAAVQDIDRKQLLDEAKIAALEAQVASLQSQIASFEARFAALEAK